MCSRPVPVLGSTAASSAADRPDRTRPAYGPGKRWNRGRTVGSGARRGRTGRRPRAPIGICFRGLSYTHAWWANTDLERRDDDYHRFRGTDDNRAEPASWYED